MSQDIADYQSLFLKRSQLDPKHLRRLFTQVSSADPGDVDVRGLKKQESGG